MRRWWVREEAPPGVPKPAESFLRNLRGLDNRLAVRWHCLQNCYVITERDRHGREHVCLSLGRPEGAPRLPDVRTLGYLHEQDALAHKTSLEGYIKYIERRDAEERERDERKADDHIGDVVHYYAPGLAGTVGVVANPSEETRAIRAGKPERRHVKGPRLPPVRPEPARRPKACFRPPQLARSKRS